MRRVAEYGSETGATIVSDTSWEGYEQIPRWIMAGYTQIFEEAHSQWDAPPDVALIQGGVGGLVCAAASWFAWRFGAARPFLIACEPENAACLFESARAGRLTTLEGRLDTIMAGLRCAEPSPAAWPAIRSGIDAFVTVDDGVALEVDGRARRRTTRGTHRSRALRRVRRRRAHRARRRAGPGGGSARVRIGSIHPRIHRRHRRRVR